MADTENKNQAHEPQHEDSGDAVIKSDGSKKVVKKKKKPRIIERVARMLREYRSELKKIVWYNREQTFKSSVIVIISILVVSACIGGLDFIFSSALMWLGKLV